MDLTAYLAKKKNFQKWTELAGKKLELFSYTNASMGQQSMR